MTFFKRESKRLFLSMFHSDGDKIRSRELMADKFARMIYHSYKSLRHIHQNGEGISTPPFFPFDFCSA